MSGKWLLLALIAALFLTTGCDDSSDPVDVSIVVPQATKAGETITITVNSKAALFEYSWVVLDETGQKLSSCDAYNVEEIKCTLETGGTTTVILTAKTRDGEDFKQTYTFNVLDMDKPLDQAPEINLALTSATVTEPAVVSTVLAKQSGVANFPVNEEVTFDFSKTTDDNDTANLKYEVEIGKDAGFQVVEKSHKHTFDKVGYYDIALRVTDQQNNISKKNFVAYVSCSDSGPTHYELAIDPTKISITPGALRNFFIYNGSTAVTGGDATKYQYKWDFNGDGIYDSKWLKPEDLTNGGIEEYTVYGGERQISMKVWDTQCNYVKETTFTHDFSGSDMGINMQLTDATPGKLQKPQIGPYFFIQGVLKGLDGFTSAMTDVDFIATKHDSSPPEEQWRVLCDYRVDKETKLATISVKGLNFYKRGNGPENTLEPQVDGKQHGFLLDINNLDVSGFTAPATPIDNGGEPLPVPADLETHAPTGTLSNVVGKVENLSYYTDEGYDKVTRTVYRKDGDCVVQVTIQTLQAAGSCSGAPTYSDVVILDGTYSCDKLTDSVNENSFEVKEGAFYCEVGKADACYGGGGGGGGLPPEEH